MDSDVCFYVLKENGLTRGMQRAINEGMGRGLEGEVHFHKKEESCNEECYTFGPGTGVGPVTP